MTEDVGDILRDIIQEDVQEVAPVEREEKSGPTVSVAKVLADLRQEGELSEKSVFDEPVDEEQEVLVSNPTPAPKKRKPSAATPSKR